MSPFSAPSLEGILRRDLRTPLYHQLQEFLRGLIVRGEIRDGEQLPREEELARRLDISRVTVRQALQVLAEEGLLVRQRGRGTRVTCAQSRTQAMPVPLKTPLGELIDNLDTLAVNTQVRLLAWERALPPQPVREAFSLDEGERLVHCIRVRSRHGYPFGYYVSWTRTEHPAFNAERLAHGSRIELFRHCGLDIVRVQQTISAAAVDAVPAMHLQMAPTQAVMTMERRSYGRDQQLLDLLDIQYRPDQLRYQMRLDYETTPVPETHP
ncbi:MAG: GntR family transcriptional regulator [Stenotrophomonas sp.]